MRENDSNGRCLMAIRIYSAISKQPKAAYFAIDLNAVYTPQKYAIWVVLKHDQLISINMWLLPELRFPKLAYQITSNVYNHRTWWFIEPWTFDCQPRPRLLTRERAINLKVTDEQPRWRLSTDKAARPVVTPFQLAMFLLSPQCKCDHSTIKTHADICAVDSGGSVVCS